MTDIHLNRSRTVFPVGAARCGGRPLPARRLPRGDCPPTAEAICETVDFVSARQTDEAGRPSRPGGETETMILMVRAHLRPGALVEIQKKSKQERKGTLKSANPPMPDTRIDGSRSFIAGPSQCCGSIARLTDPVHERCSDRFFRNETPRRYQIDAHRPDASEFSSRKSGCAMPISAFGTFGRTDFPLRLTRPYSVTTYITSGARAWSRRCRE